MINRLNTTFCIIAAIILIAMPAHAAKRVALVIGNSDYQKTTPLQNPVQDARDMAAALRRLGFEVVFGINLDQTAMINTVRRFSGKLEKASVALFYYAGHGLQWKDRNYLLPVNANLDHEGDLDFEAMELNFVLRQMERTVPMRIIFLDACRNNPLRRNLARRLGLSRSISKNRGLARVSSGVGTFIAFATEPGGVAADGRGRNSPFTAALLKHVETPGIDLANMMIRVRRDVLDATREQQVPWDSSSLRAPFYFKDKLPEPKIVKPRPNAVIERMKREIKAWASVQHSQEPNDLERFLRSFPGGVFADVAKLRLSSLKAATKKVGNDTVSVRFEEAPVTLPKPETTTSDHLSRLIQNSPIAAGNGKTPTEKALISLTKPKTAKARDAKPENPAPVGKEVEIASLGTQPVSPLGPEVSKTDIYTLVRGIQTQLERLGCNPGKIDGEWGGKSSRALRNFGKHANVKLASLNEPTQDILDLLKARNMRVCPLVCGARYEPRDGNCILKQCPSGQTLMKSGACVAPSNKVTKIYYPKKSKPSPRRRKVSSRKKQCLWFNGKCF